jgi:hypothetical protein
MMETTLIEGILQIDHNRGVIYFHSNRKAMEISHYCPTPLRICGLGEIQAPLEDRQIDITITLKGEAKVVK